MNYSYISSRSNPKLTELAKLSDKKARDESGLYIAEGLKLCREALGISRVKLALVRGTEVGADDALMCCAAESGGEIIVLSEGAFSKLSKDAAPDGIAFVIEKPETDAFPQKDEKVIMLDCVRDPGNVGTAVRTAAAFGFDRVVLSDCADIFSPKAARASMGAVFKMKITVVGNADGVISAMHKDGRRVVAAALGNGANTLCLGIDELLVSDCPVIGNEGHGVSAAVLSGCDNTVRIPMSGKTESLNAAAAAAVILWEYGKIGGFGKGE